MAACDASVRTREEDEMVDRYQQGIGIETAPLHDELTALASARLAPASTHAAV